MCVQVAFTLPSVQTPVLDEFLMLPRVWAPPVALSNHAVALRDDALRRLDVLSTREPPRGHLLFDCRDSAGPAWSSRGQLLASFAAAMAGPRLEVRSGFSGELLVVLDDPGSLADAESMHCMSVVWGTECRLVVKLAQRSSGHAASRAEADRVTGLSWVCIAPLEAPEPEPEPDKEPDKEPAAQTGSLGG